MFLEELLILALEVNFEHHPPGSGTLPAKALLDFPIRAKELCVVPQFAWPGHPGVKLLALCAAAVETMRVEHVPAPTGEYYGLFVMTDRHRTNQLLLA